MTADEFYFFVLNSRDFQDNYTKKVFTTGDNGYLQVSEGLIILIFGRTSKDFTMRVKLHGKSVVLTTGQWRNFKWITPPSDEMLVDLKLRLP